MFTNCKIYSFSSEKKKTMKEEILPFLCEYRTGKHQFSFQSQRKAMPNNVQTTTQLHSSHMTSNNAQNSPSQASRVCES